MKKKSIFTAITYPNGKPHIGHAYEYVLADSIARYSRVWLAQDTFFCTGTDEHGQKVFEKAQSEGKTAQQYVDDQALVFKELHKILQISYDRFIKTTDLDHKKMSQELWQKMFDNGDIYEKEYEGKYCVGCESFKKESDLNEKGECPDHLKIPILTRERNWFFRLSKYETILREKILSKEINVIPEYRVNELQEFMREGLQDVSFSRSKEFLTWGVEVPNDPTHVMYVWCDALTNYLTAGKNKLDHDGKNFWDDRQSVDMLNVIGKDIARFHVLYWPAMLLSAGFDVPKDILIHGHILSGGQKMSKSLGNVVDPLELVNLYNISLAEKSLLGDKVGSEFFRYFFTKNITPTDDGDFTWERAKELYNADLANGLGNLVSRVMKLSEKYLDPQIDFPQVDLQKEHEEFASAMKEYDVMNAMNYIWKLIGEADNYMQTEQPFKVVKVDAEKGKQQLQLLREKVYTIARLLNPFMPTTSEKIKEIVKTNKMPEMSLFPRYE